MWFESVAHRRNGDLTAAADALARRGSQDSYLDLQHQMALIRIEWLRGEVEEVVEDLTDFRPAYDGVDEYLYTESTLELATKTAWLGDRATTASLLGEVTHSRSRHPVPSRASSS